MKKFIFISLVVVLSGALSIIFHIILPFNEAIELPSTYAILFPEGHNVIGVEGAKATEGIVRYRNDKLLFYPYGDNYYDIKTAKDISLGLFFIGGLALLIYSGFRRYRKRNQP